jgi:hypothetical protein
MQISGEEVKEEKMTKFRFPDTNGENYHVPGDITGDSFTFGDGAGDFVQSDNGNISDNSIVFGIGAGDVVDGNNITDNTIAFGIGAGDAVIGNGSISNNTIDFGGGAGDELNSGNDNLSGNTVHFGDGFGDAVIMQEPFIQTGAISNNTFTFGDGNSDSFLVSFSEAVTLSNNKIVFGNGDNDAMQFHGNSSHNVVAFGNGSNDTIELGGGPAASGGGDYIATGTGAGDKVTVFTHTNPDTFAFTLGTGIVTGTSANYTTVIGAQGSAVGGDHVVVNSNGNGNALGNTLVSVNNGATSMASFITDLGPLQKGQTYVGNDTTDTFVVTETQSGRVGAIDIADVHTVGITNHVLTLLS